MKFYLHQHPASSIKHLIPISSIQSLVWLLPVLLALAVNLNVLQNGWGWDDEIILENISTPKSWTDLFLPSIGNQSKINSSYYRPMVSLSYHLDFLIWGHSPFGFHLSVYLAHALNTVLVFFLTQRLINVNRYSLFVNRASTHHSSLTTHSFIPLIASSLFAVHPIHAEAVAWIAGRNDVFCTTFLLVSFLLYIRARRTGDGKTKRGIAFGLSVLSFFLALLTKEAAVGFVLLFPLYDYLVYPPSKDLAGLPTSPPSGEIDGSAPNKPSDLPDRPYAQASTLNPLYHLGLWYRIAVRSLPPFLVLVLYLWMRTTRIATPYGEATANDVITSSLLGKLISATGLYLKLMILPYPHNPFMATLPSSILFLNASALALVLVGGGWILTLLHRHAVLAISLGWMFLTMMPAVAVAVLNVAATPAAERYVYAPSVGLVMIAAWAMAKGLGWLMRVGWPAQRIGIVGGLVGTLLVTGWGLESWKRNSTWRDPLTFWKTAATASPQAGFPHTGLAVQYTQLGRYADAKRHLEQAILNEERAGKSKHPDMALTYLNLAEVYFIQGKYAEAEALSRDSLEILDRALGSDHPKVAMALNNLAILYQAQHKYIEAEQHYRQVLTIQEKALGTSSPSVATSLYNLATLYHNWNRLIEAELFYRKAITIWEKVFPSDHQILMEGYKNYAALLRNMNRHEEAGKIEARVRRSRKER